MCGLIRDLRVFVAVLILHKEDREIILSALKALP